MTYFILGILIGLALGALLRGRFSRRNPAPRSQPPFHGPNYNPLPEGAIKPTPPPAPPLKRFGLPEIRVAVPMPKCRPPREEAGP